MKKPQFNEKRVLREIRKNFPESKIESHHRLEGGLVNLTFKVKIKNPKKSLVVRVYKRKNEKMVNNNLKIISYLYERDFPVPKIYSSRLFAKQGIVIMEYLKGRDATKFFDSASEDKRRRLLFNAGKLLKKLHDLKIPDFWRHHKHDVRNSKEWTKWTKKRIEKYILFAKKNLDREDYVFIKDEFKDLLKMISKDIKLVPMHWDFHLSNLLVDPNGKITGVFDFDNAMKGHNLSELGQTKYWLRFRNGDYDNFKYFLRGYRLKLNKERDKIIKGYFLLHLVAVTRSIWDRQPRLSWIINEHKKIIEEFKTK